MPSASDSTAPVDQIVSWLAQYGDELYAYVAARVTDPNVAEDVLQEAFLAAVASHARFRGDASPRTWLNAIVRRKLVDHFRRQSRAREQTGALAGADEPRYFDASRHWRTAVARWPGDPAGELEKREFWAAFDDCRSKLSPHVAEAFLLREMDQLDPAEVCTLLEITESNLFVRLHRARLALRECLEKNWFRREK